MTALTELDANHRSSLRKLYQDYPCLHGSVSAIVDGSMGKAFADSPSEPHVALGVLDFHFLAGDPLNENALPLIQFLKPGAIVITPTSDWQCLLTNSCPGELGLYPREAFEVREFNVDELRQFCQDLPPAYELRPVRTGEVEKFGSDLAPALVSNFRSPNEFISRGIGFGLLHQQTFVAGASSGAISKEKLEIEVQTRPEFRRRGFATAVAAALILYCLDHGLEPCWDAANEASSGLARKLGFRSSGKYDAYVLKRSAGKSLAGN